MTTEQIKAAQGMFLLISGLTTIVILALNGVIKDGETIAALSAVLSGTVGTHAINTKKGDEDGHHGG